MMCKPLQSRKFQVSTRIWQWGAWLSWPQTSSSGVQKWNCHSSHRHSGQLTGVCILCGRSVRQAMSFSKFHWSDIIVAYGTVAHRAEYRTRRIKFKLRSRFDDMWGDAVREGAFSMCLCVNAAAPRLRPMKAATVAANMKDVEGKGIPFHSKLQLHGWISFMKEKNKDSFNGDPISINLIMVFIREVGRGRGCARQRAHSINIPFHISFVICIFTVCHANHVYWGV